MVLFFIYEHSGNIKVKQQQVLAFQKSLLWPKWRIQVGGGGIGPVCIFFLNIVFQELRVWKANN